MTDKSTPGSAAGKLCPRCYLTMGAALHPTSMCPELPPDSPAAIVAAGYDRAIATPGVDLLGPLGLDLDRSCSWCGADRHDGSDCD